jgi:ABC-type uncharacterized transport system involved in gliding motility auxiliary subunit
MWAESDLKAEEIKFDASKDIPGPFDLGVALTRQLNEEIDKNQPKKSESRMVAIGNSTFATDSLFQDPRILNGDIFLNSVQWLASDDEQTLSIRPKEIKNRRINLTPLQAGIIGWMSSVIMPILGLVIAGVTWWRRR